MSFDIRRFEEEDAIAVCGWQYEPPYESYNLPSWEEVKIKKMGIADQVKREKEFYAVCKEQILAGYIRLRMQNDCIMAGLGLKPEYCGKGYGAIIMFCIIKLCEDLSDLPVRLEVRSDNLMAIKCYRKAGFQRIDQYEMESPSGKHTYDLMEYKTQKRESL